MSAMTLIEHENLASAAATITLSSIPQTYTDLYLLVSSRSDRGDANIDGFFFKINNGSYSGRRIFVNGTSVSYQTSAIPINNGDTATADAYGVARIYIADYTEAQSHRFGFDSVGENNATSNGMGIGSGKSTSTAAITSIVLDSETGANFKANTSVSLFGILKGSDGTTTVT